MVKTVGLGQSNGRESCAVSSLMEKSGMVSHGSWVDSKWALHYITTDSPSVIN